MDIIKVSTYIQKNIKHTILININRATDTLDIKYYIGANTYHITLRAVSTITGAKELKEIVQIVKSNIAYHLKENNESKNI